MRTSRQPHRFRVLLQLTTGLMAVVVGVLPAHAIDVPQSFTLDGQLFSDAAATSALQDSSVDFKVQVLDEAKTCVLYEETQIVNTIASRGYFSVQVGTEVGNTKRTSGDSANSMATVFQNISAINGKLLTNGNPCAVPAVAGKKRYVRITIAPATMGSVGRVLSPDLSLDSVPNAVVAERAESLQGLRASNVLQVNTAAGAALSQANLESLFTSTTRFNSLTAVVDGTSPNYMQSNSTNGAKLPVIAGAPTAPVPGTIWYDSSDQKLKFQTSVGPTVIASGGGAGDFLANGTVPMTGALQLGSNTLFGNSTASGNLTLDSTSNATKGNIILAPTGGKVGIGTTTPSVALSVSGSMQSIVTATTTSTRAVSGTVYATGAADNTAAGYFYAKPQGTGANIFGTRTVVEEDVGYPNSTVNMYGSYVRVEAKDGSSLLTNSYGFYADSGGLEDPINGYGLYINYMTGTNSWGVYQASAANKNYFAGNVGIGTTSPSTTLDISGGQTFRGVASTAAPPVAGQGKIYFDSTANKFKVSENNGAYVDLVGGGGGGSLPAAGGTAGAPGYAFSGDTNTGLFSSVADTLGFSTAGTERMQVDASGRVGVGRAPASNTRMAIQGSVVSTTNIVATGATVNLALSNMHLLKAPGGAAITLQNMVDGGTYTVYISDTTSQTYTFSGCTNSYFVPSNGPTSFRSSYTISVIDDGGSIECYINWSTGFN